MRLTFDEIRLIVIVILIISVGTIVKHYRQPQAMPAKPPTTPVPTAQAGTAD